MFGCRMPCIIRISPLNSCTWDALRLLSCICFSATSVPFQSAVYTTPNEPLPMRRPSLSSCGGITHRPAACRAPLLREDRNCPARASSKSGSFNSLIVPGTPPPSPRAANGAYLADVWPTPCGLRFVGVGAYSLVLSISPSSLKLTLRRSELGPSASGVQPGSDAEQADGVGDLQRPALRHLALLLDRARLSQHGDGRDLGLDAVPVDAAGVRREPLGRDGIATPPRRGASSARLVVRERRPDAADVAESLVRGVVVGFGESGSSARELESSGEPLAESLMSSSLPELDDDRLML